MNKHFRMGRPISESLKEYGRGIAGGLLFSFPLLYTMEVWWAGFIAKPLQLLVLLLVTFVLLLGYNRYAGMRPDASWRSVVVDSVEELGIGLLISFGVLLMLNRIELFEMDGDEIMGKVMIEAMAVSIGVSVGTAQLGTGKGGGMQENHQNKDKEEKGNAGEENNSGEERRYGLLGMAIIALCGAILVGGNVAPTEEIQMIAFGANPEHILVMVLVSLLLSVVVVFFSSFRGSAVERSGNMFYEITLDTCLSYLVALAASAFILWFFGRFDGVSFEMAFAQCVVLGVLASLGASAGRLLIK